MQLISEGLTKDEARQPCAAESGFSAHLSGDAVESPTCGPQSSATHSVVCSSRIQPGRRILSRTHGRVEVLRGVVSNEALLGLEPETAHCPHRPHGRD